MLGQAIGELRAIDLEDEAQIEEVAVSIRALRKVIEQHSVHKHQFFHIAAAKCTRRTRLHAASRGPSRADYLTFCRKYGVANPGWI